MAYSNPRKGGIIAIKLREDDELINVIVAKAGDDIVLSTANGMAIRFAESDARPMGRNTSGVKGNHIEIALHHHRLTLLPDRLAGQVEAVELLALAVDQRFRGVEELGVPWTRFAVDPPAKGDDIALGIAVEDNKVYVAAKLCFIH